MFLRTRKPLQTRIIVTSNEVEDTILDIVIYVYSNTSNAWIKRAMHRSISAEKLKRNIDAEIARATNSHEIELMHVIADEQFSDRGLLISTQQIYTQNDLQLLNLNTPICKTLATLAKQHGIRLHSSTRSAWRAVNTRQAVQNDHDESSWIDTLPEQLGTEDIPEPAFSASVVEYITLKESFSADNISKDKYPLPIRNTFIRLAIEKYFLLSLFAIGTLTGGIAALAHTLTISHLNANTVESTQAALSKVSPRKKTPTAVTWAAWAQQMGLINKWLSKQNEADGTLNQASYLQFYVADQAINTNIWLNKYSAQPSKEALPKGCATDSQASIKMIECTVAGLDTAQSKQIARKLKSNNH